MEMNPDTWRGEGVFRSGVVTRGTRRVMVVQPTLQREANETINDELHDTTANVLD